MSTVRCMAGHTSSRIWYRYLETISHIGWTSTTEMVVPTTTKVLWWTIILPSAAHAWPAPAVPAPGVLVFQNGLEILVLRVAPGGFHDGSGFREGRMAPIEFLGGQVAGLPWVFDRL